MKKNILLIVIIVLLGIKITFANSGIYSNEYVKHLKNCQVHIEKYNAEIPAANSDEKPIHLQTTETILGWKNGKCLTKSVVYSKDMKKDILSSNCAFSENQLDTVVKKMQNMKSDKDLKSQNRTQNDITKYINDNAICITKNLIEK